MRKARRKEEETGEKKKRNEGSGKNFSFPASSCLLLLDEMCINNMKKERAFTGMKNPIKIRCVMGTDFQNHYY